MSKQNLIDVFEECKTYNVPICVTLKLPNTPGNELIINPPENFDKKLDYYLATYDDNLKHKNNPEIKIINAFPIEFSLNDEEDTEENI